MASLKRTIYRLTLCLLALALCNLYGCREEEQPSPQYDFTWTPSPVIGQPVQFSSNASPVDDYHWDFGNGTISYGQNPVHAFNRSGENFVSLMVNGDMEHSVTKTVWVFDAIYISRGGSVVAGDTTWFKSNAGPDAHTFLWNFGDGETSTLPKPWHVYKKGGNYEVSLQVNGGEQTATMDLTIFEGSPHAYKIGGTRQWHVLHRIDSNNGDYMHETDTSFSITYLTSYAVSVNINYLRTQFRYNSKKSTDDLLVFDGPNSFLHYNHVLDTMCMVYEYNMSDSANWWKEYIIARSH